MVSRAKIRGLLALHAHAHHEEKTLINTKTQTHNWWDGGIVVSRTKILGLLASIA